MIREACSNCGVTDNLWLPGRVCDACVVLPAERLRQQRKVERYAQTRRAAEPRLNHLKRRSAAAVKAHREQRALDALARPAPTPILGLR